MEKISQNLICLSSLPVLLALPLPALAHGGIGSIGALAYLFYLMLAFPAIGLAVLAYILKRKKKKLNGASMVIMALLFVYVVFGVFAFSDPFIRGAFNPWYDSDSTLLSITCLLLLLIIGNYFIDRFKIQVGAIILLFCIVLLQAFFTPGARIYYPNDPLSGDRFELRRYDSHYAGLSDGRVLYFKKKMPGSRTNKTLEVVLKPVESTADQFHVTVSQTRSSWAKGSDVFITDLVRNPFRALRVKREYGVATILPQNWLATDAMLYTATGGYNYKMEWIRELLKRGASPNYSVGPGYNSLKNAVGHYDLELLGLLLAHGGDVNLKSGGGDTPLHRAVQLDVSHEGAYAMIKFLLENGADADLENDKGETPRSIAVEKYESYHESSAGYKMLEKIIPLFDSY